uniref:Uncharacterized protein n=1 Tax=Amphora coffeiformis TaxID=265554 RepID=A0A7S3P9V4_9STRA
MLRCLACKVSLAPEMSHVQSTDEEFCAFISESGRRHKNVTCSSSSSVSSHSLTPAPYSGHTRAPPDPLGSAVFDMSQNKASPTCPRTSSTTTNENDRQRKLRKEMTKFLRRVQRQRQRKLREEILSTTEYALYSTGSPTRTQNSSTEDIGFAQCCCTQMTYIFPDVVFGPMLFLVLLVVFAIVALFHES